MRGFRLCFTSWLDLSCAGQDNQESHILAINITLTEDGDCMRKLLVLLGVLSLAAGCKTNGGSEARSGVKAVNVSNGWQLARFMVSSEMRDGDVLVLARKCDEALSKSADDCKSDQPPLQLSLDKYDDALQSLGLSSVQIQDVLKKLSPGAEIAQKIQFNNAAFESLPSDGVPDYFAKAILPFKNMIAPARS